MKKHFANKLFMSLCALLSTIMLASCAQQSTASSSSGNASSATGSSAGEAKIEYPESLRIWNPSFSDKFSSLGVSDYNACEAWTEISEKTGTKIEWEYGATGNDLVTNLNLMISTHDYPDLLVYSWKSATGGVQQYCDDGVIIDLTDLYQTNLSNVYSAFVPSLNNLLFLKKSL